MPLIIDYNGKMPKIGKNVFIAENAVIIGDVEIGDNSSIWYGCILRGDVELIRIGKNTNIQDGTVIHTAHKNGPTIIGDNITVGHMCLLHACIIKNNGFIGMHSTILDYSEIKEYSFIGAKSLITMNKIIPTYEMWFGNPIKKIKDVDEIIKKAIDDSATYYAQLAANYLNSKPY